MLPTNILLAVFTFFVALFTYRLGQVTKDYTKVTKELLRQSGEAFDSERRTFEIDMVSRIVLSAAQLTGNTHTQSFAPGYVSGMVEALNKIDHRASKKVVEGLEALRKGKGAENFGWLFKGLDEKA